MLSRHPASSALNGLALLVLLAPAVASDTGVPPTLSLSRAAGAIEVDGDLSDAGWMGAAPIQVWYETNPGDNVEPAVRNVGYLAYDDRFLYAAFQFGDPEPGRIRAPYADRDNVGSDTDYGGIILDTRNTGRTAILFLANPRGIQYDAVSDDGTGSEDSSPDFFWDSAARIDGQGWTLELRIPFSSLRYDRTEGQAWRIMLYRNYPREYRYQFFTTTLPRGGSCFICRSSSLQGLQGLPSGGHLVLAPYVNATKVSAAEGDGSGNGLSGRPVDADLGFDLKWTPGANTAMDATIHPDFSQIESDVAQIGTNERFALFFPEKRPFFLEGVELLSTPIQAVYTRTITSPRWGARTTGRVGAAAYTLLVTQDRGGGSVILPGPTGSKLADQDFRSLVALGRVRHDLGRSFVGALATDREVDGGGHNRVFGPDFQWRPNERDTVTAQLLLSDTRTPDRHDLAAEWDGRSLGGHGVQAWWSHGTRRVDLYTQYKDFARDFRADSGFVPEVGVRRWNGEYGYTFRPEGWLRRLRPFLNFDHARDREGVTVQRRYSFGAGMDGRFASFARLRYAFDNVRSGGMLWPRRQLLYDVSASPSRLLSGIGLDGWIGEEVDFSNHRTGTGANVNLRFTVRAGDHLELRVNAARRWLNVGTAGGERSRLFTARVDRLRASYTLSSRLFLRGIVQWVETTRDPTLYAEEVERRAAALSASLLFAYKLDWQTVVFVGYGDERAVSEADRLEPASRELFVKVSYAFQR